MKLLTISERAATRAARVHTKVVTCLLGLACSSIMHEATLGQQPHDDALTEEVTLLVAGIDGNQVYPTKHSEYVSTRLRTLGAPVVPILITGLQTSITSTDRIALQSADAARGLLMMEDLATNRLSSIVDLVLHSENWLHAARVTAGIGSKHISLLTQALASADHERKVRILHCLADCGSNAIVAETELIELIDSSDEEISRLAIVVIQRTGIYSPRIEEAIYRTLLDDSPFRIRAGLKCVRNWKHIGAKLHSRLQALSESTNAELRMQAKALIAWHAKECILSLPEILTVFDYPFATSNGLHLFATECLSSTASTAVPTLVARLLREHGDTTNLQIEKNRIVRALAALGPAATNALPELARVVLEADNEGWLRAGTVFASIGKEHLALLKSASLRRNSESLLHVLWTIATSGPNDRAEMFEDEIVSALRSKRESLNLAALKAVAASKIQTPRIEDQVCSSLLEDNRRINIEALSCISNWSAISKTNLAKLNQASHSSELLVSRMITSQLKRFQANGL